MHHRRIFAVSAKMHAAKPPHGEPCTRCGFCCTIQLCDLAVAHFGLPDMPGPCPALEGEIGTARCGLLADPARYAPTLVAEHGVPAMSHAAGVMINAGFGCDARIDNEPYNSEYDRQCRERRRRDDAGVKQAMRLWRIE